MNKRDREIAEDSFRVGVKETVKKYGVSKKHCRPKAQKSSYFISNTLCRSTKRPMCQPEEKNRIKETNKELAPSEPTDREKKSIKSISEAVLSRMINEAKTMDELDRVGETIAKVQISPQIKERLRTHYIQRRHELSVFGTQKAEIEKDEEDVRSNYTRDRYRDRYRDIVYHSFVHGAEETAKFLKISVKDVYALRNVFKKEFREVFRENVAVYSFRNGTGKTVVEFNLSEDYVKHSRKVFKARFPKRYARLIKENGYPIRREYSEKEKHLAVEIGTTKSIEEAAREIGASKSSIRHWIAQSSPDLYEPNEERTSQQKIDINDAVLQLEPESEEEIFHYALENGVSEASRKFLVTKHRIRRLCKRLREKRCIEYNEKIAIYSYLHGIQETAKEFHESTERINLFRCWLRKENPDEYQNIKNRVSEYAEATSISDAVAFFNISYQTVFNWIKERKRLSADENNTMKESSAIPVAIEEETPCETELEQTNDEIQIEPSIKNEDSTVCHTDEQDVDVVSVSELEELRKLKQEYASLKDKLIAILLKQVGLVQILIFSLMNWK